MKNNLITYDIFHDECKEDGFWHCFIFIPRNKQGKLYSLLKIARNYLKYKSFIHFSSISRKAKTNHTKVRLIRSWISILLYSIQQQKISANLYLGHKSNSAKYRKIIGKNKKIGARLVIFRENENLKDMYEDLDYTNKIEITFRMGLKGGAHFLFNEEKVKIGKIYIDCCENVYKKNFNSYNMLTKFEIESKDNIYFEEDSSIIPVSKKQYKIFDPVSEFMQLADIAVGGFRTQQKKMKNFKARFYATKPFKVLLDKKVEIKKRMQNSRYYNGFTFSDANIVNGKWVFKNIKIRKKINNLQQNLF